MVSAISISPARAPSTCTVAPGRPTDTSRPSTRALTPWPACAEKRSTGRNSSAALARRLHNGFADRMFGVAFGGSGQRQDFALAPTIVRGDAHYHRAAAGHGTGLIQHNGIDAAGGFERLARP